MKYDHRSIDPGRDTQKMNQNHNNKGQTQARKTLSQNQNCTVLPKHEKFLAKITTPQTRYKLKYIYVRSPSSRLTVDAKKKKLKSK